MKKHYSTIVVGGGPAGSSAAYTLARQGIDVCLIDKAVFPRQKLCGGLLTPRSRKIFAQVFDAPWEKAFEFEADGARLFFKEELVGSIENHTPLFFTCRIDFDDYLINLASSKGVVLHLGDPLASIDLKNKTCHLRSGAEMTYDYLVGADGVNSLVAKTIFGSSFDKRKIALALEIEVDKEKIGRPITAPEIYFGIANWGYGWIFPKKNTVTVGVGGAHIKNPDMKDDLIAFTKGMLAHDPTEKIKGHHVPYGDYRKTPGLDNVLLAGDAAGFVDPITGEGIAYAMQSGHFAGLSIVESINGKSETSALQSYKHRCAEISGALNYANVLKYLIYPKPGEYLFIRKLLQTRRGPLFKYMDLMAGELGYDEYLKYLAARIFKKIVKRALFLK